MDKSSISDENKLQARINQLEKEIDNFKEVEKSLLKNLFWLQESQRLAQLGYFKYFIKGDFWISADSFDQVLGINKNYIRNYNSWMDLVHPDDRETLAKNTSDFFGSKSYFNVDYRIIRKDDNSIHWINEIGNIEYDETGSPISIFGTVQDITDRKEEEIKRSNNTCASSAAEAVSEGEEKYRLVFNNIPLGIFHFNLQGKLTDCNDLFLKILGSPRVNVLGMSMLEMPFSESIKTALNGEYGHFEGNYKTPSSGKVIPLKIEVAPVNLKNGAIVGGVGIVENVTEKKQIERIFFHDILNTAGTLQSLSTLLLDKNIDSQTKQKFTNLLNTQAIRIIDEIKTHRFLISSKSNEITLEIKPIKAYELLNNLRELFLHSNSLSYRAIEIVKDCENINMECDHALLGRIITNMLKNAIEASEHDDVITMGCRLQDGNVAFWVHNQAYIPEDIKSQILTSSVSTKGEGRGLGVFSMKYLLQTYLKGSISFTSTQEEGTTFTAVLPQYL
jgi:PAS domain S-box-containing protein